MIIQAPLPYEYDALEPTMSAETLHLHHDKHHASYVEKTNKLAQEAGLEGCTLEEIVAAARDKGNKKLFDNAAQAWNHAFFWRSMAPSAGQPEGGLASAIAAAFGNVATLKADFVKKGEGHFASGWLWLAVRGGALSLIDTHDAETLCDGDRCVPLLVCDLWEHAYYLDRQNDRNAYLETWFDNLANWSFAAQQLDAAQAGRVGYRHAAEELA